MDEAARLAPTLQLPEGPPHLPMLAMLPLAPLAASGKAASDEPCDAACVLCAG